jgi:Uma2 family endonuclease
MSEAGILTEDNRVELIDGEILKMSPIGSRHVGCVNRLNTLFSSRVGLLAIVSVQNPIRIDDYSEPEPDIALLKPRVDYYSQSLATAEEVLLIIEVADTSVDYDRNVKLPVYARAGISEVWIADLPGDGVEVNTEPMNGAYQKSRRAIRGEILTLEIFPTFKISVEDILG